MKNMSQVGIRAFKQNASAVVAEAAAGRVITITDRGRAVAQLTALPSSPLQGLLESGRARPPRRAFGDLSEPISESGLSDALHEARDAERY